MKDSNSSASSHQRLGQCGVPAGLEVNSGQSAPDDPRVEDGSSGFGH